MPGWVFMLLIFLVGAITIATVFALPVEPVGTDHEACDVMCGGVATGIASPLYGCVCRDGRRITCEPWEAE
jgi:hypothetical protein